MEPHNYSTVCLICLIISMNLAPSAVKSRDTITPTQPLTANQTIVSAGEVFELGFFSPGNSMKSYIGIWFKDPSEKTVVWVANRDSPLQNSSGVLRIGEDGGLVLVDEAGNTVWATNKSRSSARKSSTAARLLDSGNFVLQGENNDDENDYLWQSFDYPTDTLLAGMKLGLDRRTGLNRYLTSWTSVDDPATGEYTFKLHTDGDPEVFLRSKQTTIYRTGPWDGIRLSGVPEMKPSPIITFVFEMNEDEVYCTFILHNRSVYSRMLVNNSGVVQRKTWIPTHRSWNLFWYAPKDQCDNYRECGTYGVCDINNSPAPVCKCMKGFEPKNPTAWFLREGSDGCTRTNKLDCMTDGFSKWSNLKLPDSSSAFVDKRMSLKECGEICRRNCSCIAYSSYDISRGGSGCVIWNEDLVDLRQYVASEGGQDLYVRVAAADAVESGSQNHPGKAKLLVTVILCVSAVLAGIGACIFWKRRKSRVAKGSRERSRELFFNAANQRRKDDSGEMEDFELPMFDFSTIAHATDNFSEANKLGEGGFGSVYKGIVGEGQEIAVKRLSKNSGQGVEEFKTEMKLIARLQHRNLVRLLGCCTDGEEKMLIYEYMKHNSLDSILFKKEKNSGLDWQTRFNIICGISRGLIYLHQDSRLRIIHRDLKASNVLLDKDMEPKISDFGMARIFGGDQTEANTRRIVGTYGYMSPEYAMDGQFSIKSDVFSFGVLVLEIISGKKNRGFYETNSQLNLLAHAWKVWREGRGLELLDPAVGDSYSPFEVIRCIQVGLLCVQEKADDRPSMANVVLMLSSESISLTQPKRPGFCLGRSPFDSDSSSTQPEESCSVNVVTMTMQHGR